MAGLNYYTVGFQAWANAYIVAESEEEAYNLLAAAGFRYGNDCVETPANGFPVLLQYHLSDELPLNVELLEANTPYPSDHANVEAYFRKEAP